MQSLAEPHPELDATAGCVRTLWAADSINEPQELDNDPQQQAEEHSQDEMTENESQLPNFSLGDVAWDDDDTEEEQEEQHDRSHNEQGGSADEGAD